MKGKKLIFNLKHHTIRLMMKSVVVFAVLFIITGCNSHKVPLVPTYQQIPVIQVKKDDTLYSLAKRYDTTVQELIEKNNIADPTALKIGQDLKLPRSVRVASYPITAESTQNNTSSVTKTSIQSEKKQKTVSVEKAKEAGGAASAVTKKNTTPQLKTSSKKKTDIKTAKLDKPFVATGKVKFGWPVKGKIISSFGAKGGGVKNDGINISVAKGTAIKAAEAGIIVYAGNELKGYGNLILIRHEKEFMSAYAHADKIHVKTGQVVAKGEKIATVGTTGNVKTPQLHFEIRKKTKSVNPKKYLQ